MSDRMVDDVFENKELIEFADTVQKLVNETNTKMRTRYFEVVKTDPRAALRIISEYTVVLGSVAMMCKGLHTKMVEISGDATRLALAQGMSISEILRPIIEMGNALKKAEEEHRSPSWIKPIDADWSKN